MQKIIFLVFLTSCHLAVAQQGAAWWQPSAATTTTTAIAADVASQMFSQQEKTILNRFLQSYQAASRDMEDDDDGDRQRGWKKEHKKDKKHKKDKQKHLPPGLRKKLARGGQLPPGWQKKIARGEVIDPQVYQAASILPSNILRQLPEGPEGTSIRHIEDRVVRIMDATGVILDVLGMGK